MNSTRLWARCGEPGATRRLGAFAVAWALFFAAPAMAASGVGLVTRATGVVSVAMGGAGSTSAARDFVTAGVGDRYELSGGAVLEIVFFANGRRERWLGPVTLTVGAAGGAARGTVKPKVTVLPSAALNALRKIPLREAASSARAGGFRVRGGGPAAAGPAGKAVGAPFNGAAARKHADAVIGIAADSQATKPLALPTLRVLVSAKGAAAKQVGDAALKIGFKLVPDRKTGDRVTVAPQVKVTQPAAGRYEVAVAGGPTWTLPAAKADLEGALLAAARVARLIELAALAKADKRKGCSIALAARADKPVARVSAHIGDNLRIQVANGAPGYRSFAVVEVGPTPGIAVVHPGDASPATLAPGERRYLTLAFVAGPPAGDYRYFLIGAASLQSWWTAARAPGAAADTGIASVLRAVLVGATPAAAIRASVAPWAVAGADLTIAAAR